MTVTCKLIGGLGNNLFQICCVLAYSLKHNIDYCIPCFIDQPHTLNQKVFYSPNLKYCKYGDIEQISVLGYEFISDVFYKEPYFHFKEIPKYNCDKLYLNGYWQSYKYFQDYRSEILTLLNIPKVVTYDKIFLHFRLGDYKNLGKFHKIASKDYINSSLKVFFKQDERKERRKKLIIFSDDIELAKKELQHLHGMGYYSNVEYSTGRTDLQELAYMASCSGGIMSASSFSWWGAWLGNQNRTIVYPKEWFGESLNHDTKDLCPENWTAI